MDLPIWLLHFHFSIYDFIPYKDMQDIYECFFIFIISFFFIVVILAWIYAGYVGFKNKRVEISLYFADHPRSKGMCMHGTLETCLPILGKQSFLKFKNVQLISTQRMINFK